jgi:predicted dehydrogenase
MNAREHAPSDSRLAPRGRVALVGAGAFGRFCIDAYGKSGDVEVVAVADPLPHALTQVNAPSARLEPDWRAIVEDQQVEVVHLATPPYLRGEIVFAALEAGKSVFCEKPLALSLDEADAMIRASQRSGTALGVNYVMRFQPAYRMLEALADSGIMGRLRTISFQNFAQALSPDHWFWDRAKSGGIFVEHGVHFFDAYSRVAGAASSVIGTVPRKEAVDASVSYSSGVFGRFYHEFSFPIEVERTLGISFFERGNVEIEGWIPTRLSGAVLTPPNGFPKTLVPGITLVTRQVDTVTRFHLDFPRRQESYEAGVVAGMREVVRKHRDPRHPMTVPVEDARASLALGIACQEAAVTQRRLDLNKA